MGAGLGRRAANPPDVAAPLRSQVVVRPRPRVATMERAPRRGARVPAVGSLLLAAGAVAAIVAGTLGHAPERAIGARATPPAHHARAAVDPWAGAGPRVLFPFAPTPAQRVPDTRDALPAFWADGRPCAVGCRPVGAIDGWPLRPFHAAHALRAGLNERRPANFHVGIDIQARDGAPVYALQPGVARILQSAGVDSRVQVGSYIYWHVAIRVREGELVTPYGTVLGTVLPGAGHLHLSEVAPDGEFLNPLRPGGRVLAPWHDTLRPVVGRARIEPDGTALVSAFDPQSTHVHTTYDTPVLAPAAVAYAVFDARGARVVPLQWALRGSHHLPTYAIPVVYAPDAHSPGWACFARAHRCVPDWTYRLAGGLAPGLSAWSLSPGRYRLAVYAWDWAGNTAARDVWFRRTPGGTPSATRSPGDRTR
jgi:hypothetical protein